RRRPDRRRASRTGSACERGLPRGDRGGSEPSTSSRRPPGSSRPSWPAWCRRASRSPVEILFALFDGRLHAVEEGLPHSGDGDEIESLLYRPPVVLTDQDRVAALAGDLDRLMRLGHVVQELVKELPCLGGGDGSHGRSPLSYVIACALRRELSTPSRRATPGIASAGPLVSR